MDAHSHSLAERTMLREKHRVAVVSVLAAVFLTSIKLIIGLMTGSLGILSEAAHSGLDLVAAAITFFAIRISDRPPDEDHAYGHGKVENLSALVETLLLLATCAWILWEAYERLVGGASHIEVNVFSFAVIIVSIAIDFGRSRALYKVARKYHSQALEADALHFSSDIYSSLVVIFGLICVRAGFPAGDAIAAGMVAIIVIIISMRLGKRTIDALLDRVPEGLRSQISAAVESIKGVVAIHSLRIRQGGAITFVDMVAGIDRTLSFDRAHAVMDDIEHRIRELTPRSDITVHSEPASRADEHISETVTWIVRKQGLDTHNVNVLRANEKFHVDLDVEYPRGTPFAEAHSTSSLLEQQIRDALPAVETVCIHIEEELTETLDSHDVTLAETALIARIGSIVAHGQGIRNVASVQCFSSDHGLLVTIACGVAGDLPLNAVHAEVDRLESDVKAMDKRITKVVIHAEPV